MASNKKASNSAKKSNGVKRSEPSEDDYIKIQKKHIYATVVCLLVSIIVYLLEDKYSFLKQTKKDKYGKQRPKIS